MRNRQAQRLGCHRHAVARVGAGPAAGSGHLGGNQSLHVGVVDDVASAFANSLEHGLPGNRPTAVPADLGRPGVDVHGRDAGPQRAHDHPRGHLVAASDKHHRVEGVGLDHHLDAVGDKLARRKHVAHALAGHRDHIGRVDRPELHRGAAGRTHSGFHRIGHRPQVDVLGRDLIPGVGDCHQWTVELLRGSSSAGIPASGEDAIKSSVPGLTLPHSERSLLRLSLDCQQYSKERRLGARVTRIPVVELSTLDSLTPLGASC